MSTIHSRVLVHLMHELLAVFGTWGFHCLLVIMTDIPRHLRLFMIPTLLTLKERDLDTNDLCEKPSGRGDCRAAGLVDIVVSLAPIEHTKYV